MTVSPSPRAKVITDARMNQVSSSRRPCPKKPRTTRRKTHEPVSLPWLPVLRTSLEISGTAQLVATVLAWTTAAKVTQPCPQMYLDRFGFRLWSKSKPTSGAFFEARGTSVSSMTRYQTGGAKWVTRILQRRCATATQDHFPPSSHLK